MSRVAHSSTGFHSANGAGPGAFALVFLPLHCGKSYAFPCSADGVVQLKELGDTARYNYLLAWDLVGRDFQAPVIVPADPPA